MWNSIDSISPIYILFEAKMPPTVNAKKSKWAEEDEEEEVTVSECEKMICFFGVNCEFIIVAN